MTETKKSAVQKLDPQLVHLMSTISPAPTHGNTETIVCIDPAGAPVDMIAFLQQLQILIDSSDLGTTLCLAISNGVYSLVDTQTMGERLNCPLDFEEEIFASFDDTLVSGVFINALLKLIIINLAPNTWQDPDGTGLITDLSRKGHTIWCDPDHDDYLPFDWDDVKKLFAL